MGQVTDYCSYLSPFSAIALTIVSIRNVPVNSFAQLLARRSVFGVRSMDKVAAFEVRGWRSREHNVAFPEQNPNRGRLSDCSTNLFSLKPADAQYERGSGLRGQRREGGTSSCAACHALSEQTTTASAQISDCSTTVCRWESEIWRGPLASDPGSEECWWSARPPVLDVSRTT